MDYYRHGSSAAIQALGLDKTGGWAGEAWRAGRQWAGELPGKARKLWLDTVKAANPPRIEQTYRLPGPASAETAAQTPLTTSAQTPLEKAVLFKVPRGAGAPATKAAPAAAEAAANKTPLAAGETPLERILRNNRPAAWPSSPAETAPHPKAPAAEAAPQEAAKPSKWKGRAKALGMLGLGAGAGAAGTVLSRASANSAPQTIKVPTPTNAVPPPAPAPAPAPAAQSPQVIYIGLTPPESGAYNGRQQPAAAPREVPKVMGSMPPPLSEQDMNTLLNAEAPAEPVGVNQGHRGYR